MLAFLEGPDLIIVLVVVLVLFGGSKLPGLARSLGEASKEFRKGTEAGGSADAAGEEKVTMTKAELDALLAERDGKSGKKPPST